MSEFTTEIHLKEPITFHVVLPPNSTSCTQENLALLSAPENELPILS